MDDVNKQSRRTCDCHRRAVLGSRIDSGRRSSIDSGYTEPDGVARVVAISGDKAQALSIGAIVMRISPRYFRPAEVETLMGDATLAAEKLG